MIATPTQEQCNKHIQDTLASEVLDQMLYDLKHEDGVWSIIQLLCDLGMNSAENYIFMRDYVESGDRHERKDAISELSTTNHTHHS
tara:strand:- start:2287 stop:2544 length:258 start_codon:yes stop_codon:yes gene_type:complete